MFILFHSLHWLSCGRPEGSFWAQVGWAYGFQGQVDLVHDLPLRAVVHADAETASSSHVAVGQAYVAGPRAVQITTIPEGCCRMSHLYVS
jgi:hypothetical protein